MFPILCNNCIWHCLLVAIITIHDIFFGLSYFQDFDKVMQAAEEDSKKIHDSKLSESKKKDALLQIKFEEVEWSNLKYECAIVYYSFLEGTIDETVCEEKFKSLLYLSKEPDRKKDDEDQKRGDRNIDVNVDDEEKSWKG